MRTLSSVPSSRCDELTDAGFENLVVAVYDLSLYWRVCATFPFLRRLIELFAVRINFFLFLTHRLRPGWT